MFISIIIPTHNSEQTLSRCLDSIIEQNHKDFQVWLIDAESTDDTLQIIQKYRAKYLFINSISEPDKGIYDAMNKGIELCTGEWIYFMGSDDSFYDKNVLSIIADAAGATSAEVIYGNVVMRGENQWNLNNVVFNGEYDLEKLLELTINHQAMFYKKNVFKKHGLFDLNYQINADYDFNLRCFAKTSFQYINLIVANFYVGGRSTNATDRKFHRDRGALMFKYFGKKIFTRPFINSRLYLQRAVLSPNNSLNIIKRGICLLAYVKLKLQATLT